VYTTSSGEWNEIPDPDWLVRLREVVHAATYGGEAADQYGGEVAGQYGGETASQYGGEAESQYGGEAADRYGGVAAVQYGEEGGTTSLAYDPNQQAGGDSHDNGQSWAVKKRTRCLPPWCFRL
jgi:hypothetical protein